MSRPQVRNVRLWYEDQLELLVNADIGRVHTTALGPERFRNATGRPCSHLFHCVRSFRNEPTTSRCDRSGTVPERVRLALWCERATGPVPEPFQLPVTFVDSQPILHISKRSSLHGILPQIVWSTTDWSGYLSWSNMGKIPDCPNFGRYGHSKSSCANYVVCTSPIYSAISRGTTDIVSLS